MTRPGPTGHPTNGPTRVTRQITPTTKTGPRDRTTLDLGVIKLNTPIINGELNFSSLHTPRYYDHDRGLPTTREQHTQKTEKFPSTSGGPLEKYLLTLPPQLNLGLTKLTLTPMTATPRAILTTHKRDTGNQCGSKWRSLVGEF